MLPDLPDSPEFEVHTEIEAPTGRIGVFGWPFELKDEYTVEPGTYEITFCGFALEEADRQEDYYTVQIRRKQNA